MISALRKIEGRGEIPGANSAVMEMCIDNPREGFSNIFDTHPSVEKRVEALVKFAGGHDPGPLALAAPGQQKKRRKRRRPPAVRGRRNAAAGPVRPLGSGADSARSGWAVGAETAVTRPRKDLSNALA